MTLERNVEAARSVRTRAAYAAAWAAWAAWAAGRGEAVLGAGAEAVARYLSELGERCTPATVRVHAAAIAAAHADAGRPSPTASALVRRALAGQARRFGTAQAQATPIDADAWERITETADTPRRTRGGRLETQSEASRRALLDCAAIGLMRDAMLRRSEAAALRWSDLTLAHDGSGQLRIRRSKTDQTGTGAVRYVSPEVVEVVTVLRTVRSAADDAPLLALSPSQICRRIAAACAAAGLEGAFSGHSPRVGMAVDLARAGFSMPQILRAGRWRTARTALRYIEGEIERSGAVAQWYAARPLDDEIRH